MNSQDALKETGKAVKKGYAAACYAKVNEDGLLWLYLKENDEPRCAVQFREQGHDWQPYHEVKEIKPEKAGELWETPNGDKLFTIKIAHGIHFIDERGHCWDPNYIKSDWIRRFPEVEDKKVCAFDHACLPKDDIERIEFEGVNWDLSDCWQKRPMPFIGDEKDKEWGYIRATVSDKPAMKMILEVPKVCSHGKGLNDYCEPCGRTHGG